MPTFLLAISHNKASLHVYILVTDKKSSFEQARTISVTSNAITGRNLSSVLPITWRDAELISPDYQKDYGYSYTDAAIEYLIANNDSAQCNYYLFTNGDNLYTTGFADLIQEDMLVSFLLIYSNF